jgi:hypothetical protein
MLVQDFHLRQLFSCLRLDDGMHTAAIDEQAAERWQVLESRDAANQD